MTKQLSISIIIPCWNSEAQLKKNLPSVLVAAKKADARVIVVDDHSQDRSVDYLESLKTEITLLKNDKNLGFGETVNRGVSYAKSDLVSLLNTDVRPASNCFVNARKYFVDKSVFAVGFNSNEGSMRVSWNRGLFHHFKSNNTTISLWASGGQAMFNREKYLTLGGMDALYTPFYWEDTDLGYNAWKRGWKVLWGKDCHCVHDHKASVIRENFVKDKIYTTAQRNQFLFIWKNISDPKLLLSHILYLPFYLLQYPRPVFAALKLLPDALISRKKLSPYWKLSDQDILKLWP
ncbi:MAG: glycosyltransferase family 2 protein [Candidatus Microgenomates bacterium]